MSNPPNVNPDKATSEAAEKRPDQQRGASEKANQQQGQSDKTVQQGDATNKPQAAKPEADSKR